MRFLKPKLVHISKLLTFNGNKMIVQNTHYCYDLQIFMANKFDLIRFFNMPALDFVESCAARKP